MYAFFERLFNPLDPAEVERPPTLTRDFFVHFLGPVKGLLVVTLAVSGVAAVAELVLYYFLGTLVDWLTTGNRETFLQDYSWGLLGMAFVAVILRPVATLASRGLVNLSLVPGLTNRVRWLNHRYVLRQSLTYFNNDFAGRIAQKVLQTGNAVREAVVNVIDGVWFLLIYLFGTLVLFAGIDWRLLLPVLAWTLSYATVIYFMVPPVRRKSAAVSEANSALTGRIVDSYTNIQSVKLFAESEREDGFVAETIGRHTAALRRLMRSIIGMTIVLTVLNTVLIVVVAGLSIALWMNDSITTGAIAVAISLIIRLTQMSGWILRTVTHLFENIGTVQNGIETISQPYAVQDRSAASTLSVDKGEVRFESIGFHYGKENGVIENLSLTVAPGEKVGIVGRSGAGKSTLVNLLLRFYDLEDGRILIDGQDIAAVTQQSLRAQIAMVTQDTSLLHRSIRENILYGRPEAAESEMRRAAELAEAQVFIPELEDLQGRRGYDAHVGERGVKLSGGQRQRIAIARVILKNAPILILDEATSALDSEVEAAIQGQLKNLMAGKTVIAIAHRLSTIAALDRLVVMDEGHIVEQGSHQELLRLGGLYARLWERQSGGFLGLDAERKAS